MSVLVTKPPLGAEVDWARPINRDLVGCWLLNEGMGTRATDLAYGEVARPVAAYAWREGLRLQGGNAAGDGECWRASNTARLEAGLGSMTLLAWATVWQQQRGMFGGIRYGGLAGKGFLAGASGMGISVRNESLHVQARAGATFIAAYASTNIIDGRPHLLAGVLDRERAQLSSYIDEKKQESADVTPLAGINLTMPTESFTIGSNSQSPARFSFLGHIHAVMVWKRALTADEIAWLYSEPYAGIRTVERPKRYYSISRRPRVHHVRRPRLDPRQKPPLGAKVDWAHPLNEGLQCCLLFNEGAGRPADIARPGLARNLYPIMWKTRDRGVSISDNTFYLDHQIKYPVREVTIVIRVFYHTPNTQNNRSMVYKYSSPANGNYRLVLHDGDDEGYVTLYANADGAWGSLTKLPGGEAPRLTIGTWNDVVATYSPKTGGKIYINGRLVPISVKGPIGELYQNAIDPIAIGFGNTSCYDSDFLAIYDRELSSAEIAWLYAEPYAGLLPPTSRRIYSYSRRGIIRARAIDGTPFGGSIIR